MNRIRYIIFALTASVLLSSCIVVKKESDTSGYQTISLSPKPEIEMSENTVRSIDGDMIAFLPKEWFFVDIEDHASSEVFAVAVNPDYTLSLVFMARKKSQQYSEIVDSEGLFGLSRVVLDMHQKKAGGAVTSIGKPRKIEMGNMEFVEFEFASSAGGLGTKAACFISSIGNYYEIALSPMTFRGKPLPTNSEMDMIFRSVLATVQF